MKKLTDFTTPVLILAVGLGMYTFISLTPIPNRNPSLRPWERAYQEGLEARKHGVPAEANPNRNNDVNARWWLDGWIAGNPLESK